MLIKYSKDNKTSFEEGMQHHYYINLKVRKIEEKEQYTIKEIKSITIFVLIVFLPFIYYSVN